MAVKSAIFVVMICCLVHTSCSYQFVAGGRDGWVLKPSEDYTHWASRMRFQVNDTILFKYKRGSDSVLVVKKDDYDKCNVGNPLLKLDGGDSVFKFDRSGPFYFISGKKSSCDQGQKLITVVMAVRSPPSTPKVSPPHGSSSPAPSPGGGGGAEAPFIPYGGAPSPATSGSGPSSAPAGSGPSPAPEGSSGSGPSPAPEGSGSGSSPSPAPEGSGSGSGPSPAPEGSGSGYGPSPSPEGSGSGSGPSPAPEGSGSGSEGPSPAGGSSEPPSSSTTPGSPGSSPPDSSTAGGPGSSTAPGSGTPADANSPPGSAAAPPCSASILLVSVVLSFGAVMISP